MCPLQVRLKGQSQGLGNILYAIKNVKQCDNKVITRFATFSGCFWGTLLAKICNKKRKENCDNSLSVEYDFQNAFLVKFVTQQTSNVHLWFESRRKSSATSQLNYDWETLIVIEVNGERCENHGLWNSNLISLHKTHWKMSRLPNLTHVNRESEQQALWDARKKKKKPTSVLDGIEKTF